LIYKKLKVWKVGGWWMEVGDWRMEVRGWRMEVGE